MALWLSAAVAVQPAEPVEAESGRIALRPKRSPRPERRPALRPLRDALTLENDRYVATSDCPWLRIDVDATALAGRWVRLRYRTGLLDPLARPVVRCVGGAGEDAYLPAALFGRADWLGFIPRDTTELWISPAASRGPFAFAMEAVEVVPTAGIAMALLRRSPLRFLAWAAASLARLDYAARAQVRRTVSATPLAQYDAWRREHWRPLDASGFDQPGYGWGEGPVIAVLVDGRGGEGQLGRLRAALSQQPYPHWRLRVSDLVGEGTLDRLNDDDLVWPFRLGDEMPPYALAALAAAAIAAPEACGLFGDEDRLTAAGRYVDPRLLNDAGSIFARPTQDDVPFAIRAGLARAVAAGAGPRPLSAFRDAAWARLAGDPARLHHVRRVLRSRADKGAPARAAAVAGAAAPAGLPTTVREGGLRASIVIPTRNRAGLLERCIGSLRRFTDLSTLEIIVVDNGSTNRRARALLARLEDEPAISVVPAPGSFNFSRLCNIAAARAKADTLIFLNNDTECLAEGWLEPLLAWAARPDVGAVGAKLLYPDGTIQHAGLMLGCDGRASHRETHLAKDDAGYFGRLLDPHEVSAVTGACLAVARDKFVAVGGFDEVNLPVELNDVDLCLRLAERGWKTVLAPGSVLVHRESASRGVSLRPDERYGLERRVFGKRWARAIRDDPFFHPALSVDSIEIGLG